MSLSDAEAAHLDEEADLREKATRNLALEEAARLAETVTAGPLYFVDGRPNAAPVVGGEIIAAAIRKLKQP